jgi:DNA-binding MarR family transcriptional regulator
MRLIWALDHALQKASKQMSRSIGVTGPQRLVIRIVARFPGITAGQIAELLHLHPSTVTGILKRLQRQGLLHRRSDPRDRRRAFLAITEKGRLVDSAGAGTVEAAVEKLMAATSAGQLSAARQVLSALASVLNGPR